MTKTILVAGKDMPDCSQFCEAFSIKERYVAAASADSDSADEGKKTIAERKAQMEAYNEAKTIEAQSGSCTFEWNKASSLSARSLILQTESAFGNLCETVLYFDEEWFASQAEKMDAEEISRCCDEMISGFQNVCLEILTRYEKNYTDKPGALVFFLNECPNVADTIRVPALRNGSVSIASPLVAAGASAFAAFAENIAAVYGDSPFVNIILVRTDCSNEKNMSEAQVGEWMAGYLDSVSEQKNKLTSKKSMQWIKAGAKPRSSFIEALLKMLKK